MTKHKLVDDTLIVDNTGIIARCQCGWISRGHFSSMSASVDFQEHLETHSTGNKRYPREEDDEDNYEGA